MQIKKGEKKKINRIEYYRKLIAEYAMETNNIKEYEDICNASEKTLINYAISDAIYYWEKQKKEQPNN